MMCVRVSVLRFITVAVKVPKTFELIFGLWLLESKTNRGSRTLDRIHFVCAADEAAAAAAPADCRGQPQQLLLQKLLLL